MGMLETCFGFARPTISHEQFQCLLYILLYTRSSDMHHLGSTRTGTASLRQLQNTMASRRSIEDLKIKEYFNMLRDVAAATAP